MEIIIASKNKGKIKEFKEMLEPKGYLVKSLLDFDEEVEIEETGKTFRENAYIKAKSIADKYHVMAIADDSGLEIDYLDGKPGVYSSRWLGEDTPYTIKNQEVLRLMDGINNRTCRYVCCIAIVQENKEAIIFEENVEGEIAMEANGNHGFGYDPIVYYPPLGKTMAEMKDEEKNAISHRGKAVRKLQEWLEHE